MHAWSVGLVSSPHVYLLVRVDAAVMLLTADTLIDGAAVEMVTVMTIVFNVVEILTLPRLRMDVELKS